MIEILKYPSPALMRPSESVSIQEGRAVAAMLREALKTATWGKSLGMAAPQIGLNKRVFIASGKAYINPYVLKRSGAAFMTKEGCYSLAENKLYDVSRHPHVLLRWWDIETGRPKTGSFNGPEAQIIQHEIDHLEGKLCSGVE